MPHEYFVYILSSTTRELYIGVTNNLARRVAEHRSGLHPDSHANTHGCTRLTYVETCGDVRDAIRREKQLKGWRRRRKIELIEKVNPDWRDLSDVH